MRGRSTGTWIVAAAALALASAAQTQDVVRDAAEQPTAGQEGAERNAASQGDVGQEPGSQDAAPLQDAASPGAAAPEASAEDDAPQGAAAQSAAAEAEPPYTVECGPDPEEGSDVCQVDRGTYIGWRRFHSICHTCHAQDAVGSTFAPALLPRIRAMDKARFVEVVDQGFTGQVGVMPGWGANPNVNKYYEELWSYLRARADGVLLPGRPKRLPDEP